MRRWVFVTLFFIGMVFVVSVSRVNAVPGPGEPAGNNASNPDVLRATGQLSARVYEAVIACAELDYAWKASLWDMAKDSPPLKCMLGLAAIANCLLVLLGTAVLIGLGRIGGRIF